MKVEKTAIESRQDSGVDAMVKALLGLPDDGSKCLRLTTAAEVLDLTQARVKINEFIFKTQRDGPDILVWKRKRLVTAPVQPHTHRNRPQY